MDVLILNMNDLPSLLHNVGGNKQNWIKIKLVGTKCNRTAIGARVQRHHSASTCRWMRFTAAQASCRRAICGCTSALARPTYVDAIEVKWPTTQKIEKFTQVKANQILTIREGDGIVATFKPTQK